MATSILPPDFKEFLRLLSQHKAEYLLVGGYAVGYYGYPRATADIDIWINKDPDNAVKLISVLKDFGFNNPQINKEIFLQDNQIIRMGVPPLRIELITTISGVEFIECFPEKFIAIIDNVEVNLISLKHLKINKKASGRYKDLDDLDHLP
jgi:hypothetical protein